MKRWKRAVVLTPVVGPTTLFLYRARTAVVYQLKILVALTRWLFTSREVANHTYDLEVSNKRHLAALIAYVLNMDYAAIKGYIDELEADISLTEHITKVTAASPVAAIADGEGRAGRRLGWYAIARATKPKVVVETGVDKGLGACVLAAALIRNRAEGFEGRYYGTDIDSDAGYLLSGKYAEMGEILYGDSVEILTDFDHEIDLFINDSDHSSGYEAKEYATICDKLSDGAIVLGDNSHCTDELFDFSLKNHRRFLFFAEKPANHWYPGAGIGISFIDPRHVPE